MSEYHIPVLLDESISALITDPSGLYVDATFGGGGHSAEILSRLSENGRLLAFDRDSDALANCPDDSRFTLIHNNFRFVHNFALLEAHKAARDFRERDMDDSLESGINKGGAAEENPRGAGNDAANAGKGGAAGAGKSGAAGAGKNGAGKDAAGTGRGGIVDGILADLGVSSHQFDTAERGFSFRFDAALDMRMNALAEKDAAAVVNGYEAADLERIFRIYGELDNARKLTSLIVSARAKAPISTTTELNSVLSPVLPPYAEHKFLAKVYQALRIEVNDEMRSLEKFLEGAADALRPGGRLVVITYQSLEDRMVKNFIRSGNIEGRVERDVYGRCDTPLEAVNRKPILPSEAEISANTRARSAKMRIAQKLDAEPFDVRTPSNPKTDRRAR